MISENFIDTIKSGILSSQHISGLTHGFYNYPARFSPKFSKSIIEEFTSVGDIVLDPFMGGGTSIVEASALGRRAAGIDINELAVFVTRVKTNLYTDDELQRFGLFANHVVDSVSLIRHYDPYTTDHKSDNIKNVDTNDTWRLARLIAIYRDRASRLELKELKELAKDYEIGSHSLNHLDFRKINKTERKKEFEESKKYFTKNNI